MEVFLGAMTESYGVSMVKDIDGKKSGLLSPEIRLEVKQKKINSKEYLDNEKERILIYTKLLELKLNKY